MTGIQSGPIILELSLRKDGFSQRRKGVKAERRKEKQSGLSKPFLPGVLLCAFAPLREPFVFAFIQYSEACSRSST
jgi:hypothetical protein